jgi:Transposase DDE domain
MYGDGMGRLCEEHVAYQWICGGVGVNYYTLSDFRVQNSDVLDELLTQSVAALMKKGVVELTRVAQDGVKVRASAGASSFRRKETLRAGKREARDQVAVLKKELDEEPAGSRRQQASRQRAAQDRLERVTRALKRAEELETEKPMSRHQIRVFTTGPDARVMKMGDGGFLPAYNVQLLSDTESQAVLEVEVTTAGSDQFELLPMINQLEERYRVVPAEVLVDGGCAAHSNLEALEGRTTVIAPVPRPTDPAVDPYKPRPTDSLAVDKWRKRMATPRAKRIYKERAATAECLNAQARNRGVLRFLVRGLEKVRAVALWDASGTRWLTTRIARWLSGCSTRRLHELGEE